MFWPGKKTFARSKIFLSSLIFPGHSYVVSASSPLLSKPKGASFALTYELSLRRWVTISGMSSERSRRVGTWIGKTFSRNSKSSRNLFCLTNSSKSLCVAHTTLTSNCISARPPTLVTMEFSSTRSNFDCKSRFMSPISSRNRVPLFACSNFPGVVLTAPVKAPFSYPNNSASIKSRGMAAQLTATNLPFRRLASCKLSATNSLPTPVWP